MKKALLILFSIVILLEIYVSNFRVNFAIQTVLLLFILVLGRGKIAVSFLKTIFPIIIVFIIGLFAFFWNDYYIIDFIKDFSHFTKPIVAISIGYLVFKIVNNPTIFLKTIVYIALITALIHLISVFGFSGLIKGSIKDVRQFGLDNFIEIFAFFILLFSSKYELQIFNKRIYKVIIISILIVSVFLYFSRTMLGMIIILGFSFYGLAKITTKSIKIAGVILVVLFLFYGYLSTIKLERNSKGIEALLYKIKIAPEEVFNAKVNREDHRKLWDHWRAYEAKRAISLMEENPSSFIVGTGYGSLVNLKFKAPLGENGMRYISVLHNGYVFVFYKTGILGIFFYFLFLINLYLRVYHYNEDKRIIFFKILISTIGIYFLFTSIIITGIYIPKDSILFILGGALFFETNTKLMT